jgi:hypothetical protein
MCSLRLPENASQLLDQTWPAEAADISEYSKWLIYSLDSALPEAEKLYCAIKPTDFATYGSEPEWEETISWMRPALQNFAAPDLQHILDHHFRMVERLFAQAHQTGSIDKAEWTIYQHGFVVITEENWRENGVTAVHCDEQRGKWKVTKCSNIPIDELFQLSSILDFDEQFDNLRKYYDDGSGNDGPDNQGGPTPVNEWQFAVYCTGPSDISASRLSQRAQYQIPDPRGAGSSYSMGEACLDFIYRNPMVPEELVNEDWPPTYAEFMNNPIVKGNNQPKIVRPHPSLFVHIRGDPSNLDTEIVNMEWDHDIARSEEELKKIGRESRTTTQKCEAVELVATLERLAREF